MSISHQGVGEKRIKGVGDHVRNISDEIMRSSHKWVVKILKMGRADE